MRKKIKIVFFAILICAVTIMGCFTPFLSSEICFANETSSSFQATTTIDDISIFIRKPTYSVFCNNKLYFIDDADKLLKVYNTDDSSLEFESDYLDLSDFEILDASFISNNLFLLVKSSGNNTEIVKINLENSSNLSAVKLNPETKFGSYKTIFAQNVTYDENSYTLITLSTNGKEPRIVLLDSLGNVSLNFELSFNIAEASEQSTLLSTIKNGLKKTISYQKNGTVYICFVYNSTIAFCGVGSTLESLRKLDSTLVDGNKIMSVTNVDSVYTETDYHITEVNFAKIANVDYLAFFFKDVKTNNEFVRFYGFDFADSSNTINQIDPQFDCLNSFYILNNGDAFSYVDQNEQKIILSKISYEKGVLSEERIDDIVNPRYDINYSTPENFTYKQTISETELFDNPWGANPQSEVSEDKIIPSGVDVIKVGKALIKNKTDLEIKDYDFCMYTIKDTNYFGFIKTSTLKEKKIISVSEAGYKPRVAVWPNASLYSLPTTVVSGNQNPELISKKVLEKIEDNSEIEVLDVICEYSANNTKMVKVCVNGNQVGYIEAKCIHSPAEIVEFVITNATIKKDNTTVYLSPNGDATTLTFKLNAGKNVRINGKRDTKTGFTSITFNDEYGNEFSGYIETDYIKSDAWSTLQIVGCVLIAINIGLLILILVYKKEHLGGRGQKIENKNDIAN